MLLGAGKAVGARVPGRRQRRGSVFGIDDAMDLLLVLMLVFVVLFLILGFSGALNPYIECGEQEPSWKFWCNQASGGPQNLEESIALESVDGLRCAIEAVNNGAKGDCGIAKTPESAPPTGKFLEGVRADGPANTALSVQCADGGFSYPVKAKQVEVLIPYKPLQLAFSPGEGAQSRAATDAKAQEACAVVYGDGSAVAFSGVSARMAEYHCQGRELVAWVGTSVADEGMFLGMLRAASRDGYFSEVPQYAALQAKQLCGAEALRVEQTGFVEQGNSLKARFDCYQNVRAQTCTVAGFELPQDTSAAEEWIKGAGDPQYLLYWQNMPAGVEAAWSGKATWLENAIGIGLAWVGVGKVFRVGTSFIGFTAKRYGAKAGLKIIGGEAAETAAKGLAGSGARVASGTALIDDFVPDYVLDDFYGAAARGASPTVTSSVKSAAKSWAAQRVRGIEAALLKSASSEWSDLGKQLWGVVKDSNEIKALLTRRGLMTSGAIGGTLLVAAYLDSVSQKYDPIPRSLVLKSPYQAAEPLALGGITPDRPVLLNEQEGLGSLVNTGSTFYLASPCAATLEAEPAMANCDDGMSFNYNDGTIGCEDPEWAPASELSGIEAGEWCRFTVVENFPTGSYLPLRMEQMRNGPLARTAMSVKLLGKDGKPVSLLAESPVVIRPGGAGVYSHPELETVMVTDPTGPAEYTFVRQEYEGLFGGTDDVVWMLKKVVFKGASGGWELAVQADGSLSEPGVRGAPIDGSGAGMGAMVAEGRLSIRETQIGGYLGRFGTCQHSFQSSFHCTVAKEGDWEFDTEAGYPDALAFKAYFENLERLDLVQASSITVEGEGSIGTVPMWALQVESGGLSGAYRDTDADGNADYLSLEGGEVTLSDVDGPEGVRDGVFDTITVDTSPFIGDNCYFPATVISYDKTDTSGSNWCAIEGGAWNAAFRVAPEVGTVAGAAIGGTVGAIGGAAAGGVGAIPGAAGGAIGGSKVGGAIGAAVYTFGVTLSDTVGITQTEWPG